MDLSSTVWPLKTTSGFGKTGNSASERRLTPKAIVTVGKRDIWPKRLQKGDKRRPINAYAETRSRNMAETAYTNSQYPASYSALIEYIDVSAIVWPLKTISRLVDFWATVCETSPYAIGPLSVLSVCNVGVLWPNGWMDQDETWHGGRTRPSPYCVRWGPSSPPQNRHSPQFSAHVCCRQTAG